MGQKTNPIILRLGKNLEWKSKYFEKKSTEIAKYTFQDYEIERYIQQILKNYGLMLHTCKLSYKNFSIHIFISYYLLSKPLFKNFSENKNSENLVLNPEEHFKYQNLKYKKTLKHFSANKKLLNQIAKFKSKNVRLVKQKPVLTISNNFSQTMKSTKSNSFIRQMTEGLGLFTRKKLDILLTLHQLNKNIVHNRKNSELIKRKVLNFRRFNKEEFFNDAIAILIICVTQKNSAHLLAEFIAIQLKKQKKRHSFFLRFLKNLLAAFSTKNFSILKGIQVKIKGRFNRAPRAKNLILKIGQIPIISLNSKVSYSQATSYAQNGTFGVKVLLIEKF